jgi:hypothetical protein
MERDLDMPFPLPCSRGPVPASPSVYCSRNGTVCGLSCNQHQLRLKEAWVCLHLGGSLTASSVTVGCPGRLVLEDLADRPANLTQVDLEEREVIALRGLC